MSPEQSSGGGEGSATDGMPSSFLFHRQISELPLCGSLREARPKGLPVRL